MKTLSKETLETLFEEAETLYDALQKFSDRLIDEGLAETIAFLGIQDAKRMVIRTGNDLTRRIEFIEPKETALFECRDIGSGIETGEVELPALDGPDQWGKRPYRRTDGVTVYLFDDELIKEN